MGISTLVIVNTEARNLRFGHRWARCEAEVMRRLAPAELEIIDDPGEAADTAKEAALAGYGRLVVAGDLATDSAFVNGLMGLAESHLRGLKIGFLAFGRPNAWTRALGIHADLGRQLEVLSAANVLPYDVGKLECADAGGRPVTRYFLAGAAILPARPPANVRGTVNAVRGEDGGDGPEEHWSLGFAMLSPRYPGMGLISPLANPSDGMLDLAWIDSTRATAAARSLLASLMHMPTGLSRCTAQHLRLRSQSGTMEVQADGLSAGFLPATLKVVPRVLPVIVESIGIRLRERQRKLMAELGDTALAGNVKRWGAGGDGIPRRSARG